MKTFTVAEVQDSIIDLASGIYPDDMQTDNEGQLVIYTDIYRWEDGTFHDKPDPRFEE